MNRALPTVAMTAAGLALLANFQTSDPAVKLGTASVATPATQLASASSPQASSATGTRSSRSSSSTPPPTNTATTSTVPPRTPTSGSAPATTGPTPAPTTATAPPETAPPLTSPPTTALTGTFTGPEVRTRFGPVQVMVTIQDGRMVDVQALELPDHARTSRWINDQAGPILNSEALRIQSADIQHLGGATYTWRAYTKSLQAALDQAGYQPPTAVAG